MQKRLGFLNARLEERMGAKGVTGRALAGNVGTSYEQIRRILNGQSLPSDLLLNKLCRVLQVPEKEMYLRRKKDRLIFEFGDTAWQLNGLHPKAAPIYILLPLLAPEVRERVLVCMRAVAKALKNEAKRRDTKGKVRPTDSNQ